MKFAFATWFLILSALTVAIWRLEPPPPAPGVVQIYRTSDNNPVRQAQIEQFNKTSPKLKVVLDPNPPSVEKIIVESMGGAGSDLFDVFDPLQLSAYVQAGIVWDMTDALAQRGINLERDCFSSILPTATYEGRSYGIPTNIAVTGIWYHKDLLAEAGIQPKKGPWLWEEFIAVAKTLTLRKPDGKPIRFGFYFDWWNWAHFFLGYNASIYTSDGKRCIVDSPEAIAAAQLMHDLVYKYRVSPTPLDESAGTSGGFGSGSISVFGAKQAAMALGGRYWLVQLRDQYKDINAGVMESPTGGTRKFSVAGRSVAINVRSKRKQLAFEYLLSLAESDYNNLVNDQADGISAFRKFTETKEFLFNSAYPRETDNEIWREITEFGAAVDTSPYISGAVTWQTIYEQLELVKSNQKTASRAMKDAAKRVNEEIQKNVASDPELMRRYNEVKP